MSFTLVFSLYNVVIQNKINVNNKLKIKKLFAFNCCVPIETTMKESSMRKEFY